MAEHGGTLRDLAPAFLSQALAARPMRCVEGRMEQDGDTKAAMPPDAREMGGELHIPKPGEQGRDNDLYH